MYIHCRPRIAMLFGRTMQYGTRMWIITVPPVSFQTPPDGRPPTHAATVHAADRHARTCGSGGWCGSDFNVPRRRIIPVWRRRCPRESWHVTRCLHEIMVTLKLLCSGKIFWCWLPRGCADQSCSFVKLSLLSNQWRSRHICSWVKMKDETILPTGRWPVAALHQDEPDYMTLL